MLLRYKGAYPVQNEALHVQGMVKIVYPPNGRKGGTRALALRGSEATNASDATAQIKANLFCMFFIGENLI
jgi:hypothetical protein